MNAAAAHDTIDLPTAVTVDPAFLRAVLKTMHRDSAYRGGAAVARRYGGAGTVTVFSVLLPGGVRTKIDAFGATPADRIACAKAWVELVLLRRASASDAQISDAWAAMAKRGSARQGR